MTKSSIGVYKLRCAIVDYLYEFRGMNAPEQIIVGAGTEYLWRIIQLLGYSRACAVEDPGYQKYLIFMKQTM